MSPALVIPVFVRPGLRRGRRQEGFTLVELLLALTVLALAVAVVLPRMPDLTGMAIEKDARRLERLVRLTRTRAVSLRRYYRIVFDLEDPSLKVEYYGPQGLYIAEEAVRTVTLEDSVRLRDVVTQGGGRVSEGQVAVHISPRGYVEPSAIHLVDRRDREITVIPGTLSGEVTISDGYLELKTE